MLLEFNILPNIPEAKGNPAGTMWGINQYYGGSSTFNTALSLATLQKAKDAGLQFIVLWGWSPRTQSQIVTAAARMKSIGLEPWVCLPRVANDAKALVQALGANCSYYEVLKEPHISGTYSYATPAQYAQIWRDVVTACRSVNPTAWYGGPVVGSPRTSPRSVEWMTVWMDTCEDIIDPDNTFISYHSYTSFGSGTQAAILGKALTQHRDDLIDVKALCTDHLGYQLNIAVSEFSWTADPNDDRWDLDEAFITQWTQTSMQALDDNGCWAAQFWWLGGYTGWDNTMSILDSYGNTKYQYDAIAEYIANQGEPPNSLPYASNISYNSTLANNPTEFSCQWHDTEGLSGHIFSTNNTGTWVNETWASLTGISDWANITKTLNETGGNKVQFKWYCNDTDNEWSTSATQTLTVEATLNTPYYTNPATSTIFAGKECAFSIGWNDAEGLSGYIFGTNNTGAWQNETWTEWSNEPISTSMEEVKILTETVGATVQWEVWANDTDDNWGDTEGLFVVTQAEYETTSFFASDALHDINSGYYANSYPYLTSSNGTVKTLSYNPITNIFQFIVNATGVSLTEMKSQFGPLTVVGATYTFDDATNLLSLYASHSSEVAITIVFTSPGIVVFIDDGGSLGFQNDITKYIVIDVESGELNGSNVQVGIYDGGGSFRFIAQNNTVLSITSHNINNVKASGDGGSPLRVLENGTSITVNTNDAVSIIWNITMEPLLPIMFILGMFGLGSMFMGPMYAVYKVNKKDYEANGFITSLVVTVLGIALFLAWLIA